MVGEVLPDGLDQALQIIGRTEQGQDALIGNPQMLEKRDHGKPMGLRVEVEAGEQAARRSSVGLAPRDPVDPRCVAPIGKSFPQSDEGLIDVEVVADQLHPAGQAQGGTPALIVGRARRIGVEQDQLAVGDAQSLDLAMEDREAPRKEMVDREFDDRFGGEIQHHATAVAQMLERVGCELEARLHLAEQKVMDEDGQQVVALRRATVLVRDHPEVVERLRESGAVPGIGYHEGAAARRVATAPGNQSAQRSKPAVDHGGLGTAMGESAPMPRMRSRAWPRGTIETESILTPSCDAGIVTYSV